MRVMLLDKTGQRQPKGAGKASAPFRGISTQGLCSGVQHHVCGLSLNPLHARETAFMPVLGAEAFKGSVVVCQLHAWQIRKYRALVGITLTKLTGMACGGVQA